MKQLEDRDEQMVRRDSPPSDTIEVINPAWYCEPGPMSTRAVAVRVVELVEPGTDKPTLLMGPTSQAVNRADAE